jgi:hypothetical protein
VCYHLTIVTPLTLSEVRSMLPAGLTATHLPSTTLARYRTILPAAQTAAILRVGSCSCDLVRVRRPEPREDERHLRERYRGLGLPRDRVIRELERHRSGAAVAEPAGGWRVALANFVAEHARNAGPTVYHLSFHPGSSPEIEGHTSPGGRDVRGGHRPPTRTVADVRANPERWLEESSAILVSR